MIRTNGLTVGRWEFPQVGNYVAAIRTPGYD